jgi:hypothetical protein
MNHYIKEVYYILKHRKPIECRDVIKWGKRFERTHRRVRFNVLNKDLQVSTVFLGFNLSWNGGLDVFETAIIRHGDFEIVGRCDTWRKALKQHWSAVNGLRRTLLD